MKPENVLIVEDDAALGALVCDLLSDAGYRPVTIADHALIGAAVEHWQPRCVILDGELNPDGETRTWSDAAAIRRAHPTLPVLMFTADGAAGAEAEAGTSRRSRDAQFTGIVTKPFVVEEFVATVKSAVDGPAMVEQAESERPEVTNQVITVFPDVGRLASDWPATDRLEVIVHELRGPLTVIRGQVQRARRHIGQDPVKERESIDIALAQTDRMAQLITDLVDHSRLAANGLSLKVVTFDLASAVVEAIGRHEYAASPRISVERPLGTVRVLGDAVRIAQILDNLLSNAVKYSGPADPIGVVLTVDQGEAQVRIADHGVGVPEDERDLLFTPFYRTSRTLNVPGTGLGLHISKRLTERHGGRLWLEATSNAGSVFAFALPVASDESARADS